MTRFRKDRKVAEKELRIMRILLCISGEATSAATRFEMKVTGVAGKRIAGVCRNVAAFERELRKPWVMYDLIILFAANGMEMERFVQLQKLMEGIPVLLVFLENRNDACKQAHLLRPRFISFSEDDFSSIAAVLHKMILNCEAAIA